jgi:hypothetical protein
MAVTIKTNNQWRTFTYGYEIPVMYSKEFNWMSLEEFENGLFVKVKVGKGSKKNNVWYYALNEFSIVPGPSGSDSVFKGWDGYINETAFSGVLIKVSSDGERYKIGRYYS